MDTTVDVTPTNPKLVLLKKVAFVAVPVAAIVAGVIVLRNRPTYEAVVEVVDTVTES